MRLQIPKAQLSEGEDAALARTIEAGCYAQWLLARDDTRPGLSQVIAAAERAREKLWAVGVRIAMRQAGRVASAAQCSRDDLFQDACVAVAEAINRFDHTMGVRFTTFVHECVQRALLEGARRARLGRPPASRADRLAAVRVAQLRQQRAAQGNDPGIRQAAAMAGVSEAAAARGASVLVSIDDIAYADPSAQVPFEAVEQVDILGLLPNHHRHVLEMRFGFTGPPKSLAEVARAHGVSVSTALRWERKALAVVRRILRHDQTRVPASVRQDRLPAASCVASPAR